MKDIGSSFVNSYFIFPVKKRLKELFMFFLNSQFSLFSPYDFTINIRKYVKVYLFFL